VEISDSSLKFDRDVKLPIYAREGIDEVWLIDVRTPAVHIFRSPGPSGYQEEKSVGRNEIIHLSQVPDVSLKTDDFLPSRP
jgi:Uma2 family endonuclease